MQPFTNFGRVVGFRYLRSKKSSSFLSAITAISIGGVALGVLTLIITLSVMSGFEDELKKRLFSGQTHVLVESPQGYFKKDPRLLTDIQDSSTAIQSVYPVLQTEVILRTGQKVVGSQLKGISESYLSWLKKHVQEWAPEKILHESEDSRLFVGQELAYNMGIIPGDLVSIVSPVESEGPLGAIPRVKRFIVEGIYRTRIPEQELHVIFSDIKEVESFLKQDGTLSQIELQVNNVEDASSVAGLLKEKLGSSYLVRSWQELNAHLFRSLQLERTVMFCILIFIIIVASFNIVSTLTMVVTEKRKSLSILRAIGATRKQVASIFLWEGLAIGLIGVIAGTSLGLLICWCLARYPVIELPEFYYDRTLPVIIEPVSVVLVMIAALVIVFIGALFPAIRASQMSPMQGIRGES